MQYEYIFLISGLDINLCLRGLQNLSDFLERATTADTEEKIQEACATKMQAYKANIKDFVKNGVRSAMFHSFTHNSHYTEIS